MNLPASGWLIRGLVYVLLAMIAVQAVGARQQVASDTTTVRSTVILLKPMDESFVIRHASIYGVRPTLITGMALLALAAGIRLGRKTLDRLEEEHDLIYASHASELGYGSLSWTGDDLDKFDV